MKAAVQKRAIHQTKRPDTSRWANKWIQSPLWFMGFGIAVAVCLVLFAFNALFGQIHPSSTWGLGYGIAATVLFVGVFFYGVKRRTMRVRALGRAWYYLQFHVYGGTLFLLLALMHVGFRVPHGVLTWWLWVLSIWVVASGLLGIVLQKWIPTLLSAGVTTEVNYDRIPELTEEIKERAERLVETSDYAVKDFYRKDVVPVLKAPQFRPIYYLGISGGLQAQSNQFRHMRAMLPSEEHGKLNALEDLVGTKLEIDAHYTLQKALRWWLYLHVPVSVVLAALLAFHIFTVLYY